MKKLSVNRSIILRIFLMAIPTLVIIGGALLAYQIGYLSNQTLYPMKAGPDISISEQHPDVNIYVEIKPIPPSGISGVAIQLDTIEIARLVKLGELDSICIEQLHLIEHIIDSNNSSARSLTSNDKPVCIELRPNLYLGEGDNQIVIYRANLENEGIRSSLLLEDSRPDTFFFPLDKSNSHFSFWLRYKLLNSHNDNHEYERTISPEIYAIMNERLMGWNYSSGETELPSSALTDVVVFTVPDETKDFVPVLPVSKKFYGSVESFYTIDISFWRPVTLFIIYFGVLGAAFFFVFLSVFVQTTELFVQVAVALLFGFFGIRQIIVPQYIDSPILADQIISLLYVYFILTTLWFLFMAFIKRKSGVNEFDEQNGAGAISQNSVIMYHNPIRKHSRKRLSNRNPFRSPPTKKVSVIKEKKSKTSSNADVKKNTTKAKKNDKN